MKSLSSKKLKKNRIRKKDKVEQTEEAQKPETKPDKSGQEELVVAKKETRSVEQSSRSNGLEQEATQPKSSSVDLDTSNEVADINKETPQVNIHIATPIEQMTQVEPAHGVSVVADLTPEKSVEINGASSLIMESVGLAPKTTRTVKTPVLPVPEAGTTMGVVILKENPSSPEVLVESLTENKPPGLSAVAEEHYEIHPAKDREYQEYKESSETAALDEFWPVPEGDVMNGIQESKDFVIPADETQPFSSTEYIAARTEVIPELNLAVQEVEETIVELAGRIKEFESEEAETARQLLDEIIVKAAEIRTSYQSITEESIVDSAEVEMEEEQLTELFIRLFEYVGMEYTLQLIDSYVKIALEDEMSELIFAAGQGEKADISYDRGTHEVIKRLLSTINRIKKATSHAYHLGRSALSLYSQQLATVKGI